MSMLSAKKLETVKLRREVALRLEEVRIRLGLTWDIFVLKLLEEYCMDNAEEPACAVLSTIRDSLLQRKHHEAKSTRFVQGRYVSIKLDSSLLRAIRLLKASLKTTYDKLFLKLLEHFCSKHPEVCT